MPRSCGHPNMGDTAFSYCVFCREHELSDKYRVFEKLATAWETAAHELRRELGNQQVPPSYAEACRLGVKIRGAS